MFKKKIQEKNIQEESYRHKKNCKTCKKLCSHIYCEKCLKLLQKQSKCINCGGEPTLFNNFLYSYCKNKECINMLLDEIEMLDEIKSTMLLK